MRLVLTSVSLVMLILGGCAQFTTNDAEKAKLLQSADTAADGYLACVEVAAGNYKGSGGGAEFVMDAVSNKCSTQLNSYSTAQTAYLETNAILTEKPLAASVETLQQRAKSIVADVMLDSAAPAAAGTAAAVAVAAPTSAPPRSATGSGKWNSDQRVYLDCMRDQGNRYAVSGETASAIAEVAQSRCASYLGANVGSAALLQEGRAQTMGAVMDAKLAPAKR